MPAPATLTPRRTFRSRLAVVLRAIANALWDTSSGEALCLHRCARCGGDAVCPMDWAELDSERWEIHLRCGDCGHWRTTLASNEDAAAFDVHLNAQTARIEAAVAQLDRERMVADVERFVHALRHDLIDAGDFAH